MTALVRAALLLALLAFVPGLLDPFMAVKAAALRVLGFALLVLAALRMAARPRLQAADFTLGAFVLAAALATLFARSPRLALLGEIEQREGLLTLLALAGLYTGTRAAHADPRARTRTRDALLAGAALAAVYALVQYAGADPLHWANAAHYASGARDAVRPGATLGNPILLGAVLAPSLAIAAARLALRRGDPWSLGALAAVLAAAIAATLSRSAWLAAGAGVCVSVVLARVGARRSAQALAITVGPALLWAIASLREVALARLGEGPSATSGPARIEIARSAWAMVRSHPWLGAGPDGFALAFPAVQTRAFWSGEWLGIPAHAHSAALQSAATLGVPATLLLMAACALVVRPLLRRGASDEASAEHAELGGALAALGVAALFNPLGLAGAACGAVLLALAAGCGATRAPLAPASPHRGWHAGAWAAAGVALVTLGFAGAELRALAEAGRARDALEASLELAPEVRTQALAAAVDEADRAAAHANREDELWRLAADAHLAAGNAALDARVSAEAYSHAHAAEAAARRACALEPARGANAQRLANALALQARLAPGRTDLRAACAAAFDRAVALAPMDALVRVDRARAELQLAEYAAARTTARQMQALYPLAATGAALEAAAWLGEGRHEQAAAALDRALAARWEAGAEPQRAAAERLRAELARAAAPH